MNHSTDQDAARKWEELYQNPEMIKERMRNWRSWGSWYSWGSPIGLSIFLLTLAGIIWIFAHMQ